MKIESPQFTEADFDSFVAEYLEVERSHLIDRMRKIVDDVELLLGKDEGRAMAGEDAWSATETLGHMVTSSQFFGWLVYEVATNKEISIDFVEILKLRDVASNEAAQQPAPELVKQLREGIERTMDFIQSVPIEDMRRSIRYLSLEMTAEDIARISLCCHLESHVEQIREAVGT